MAHKGLGMPRRLLERSCSPGMEEAGTGGHGLVRGRVHWDGTNPAPSDRRVLPSERRHGVPSPTKRNTLCYFGRQLVDFIEARTKA